jgi:hypothetical protein
MFASICCWRSDAFIFRSSFNPDPPHQHHNPIPTNHQNSISELATAEEAYAKAAHKMVKKSGYQPDSSSSSSSSDSHGGFRRCMEKEGPSVRAAWTAYMAGQARIGEHHAAAAARLATSACVLLAQTQDELSGTRQEILVTTAASAKALAAARAAYGKARGKSEGKARELAEKSLELRAIVGGQEAVVSPQGEAGVAEGEPSSSSAYSVVGGAVAVKQQQKLESKVGVLREEAAATEEALEAAEDALAAQRAQVIAQVRTRVVDVCVCFCACVSVDGMNE